MLNLMLVIRLEKVGHQKLIFRLLQVLSSQTRVKLLLCLRADFLVWLDNIALSLFMDRETAILSRCSW